MRIKKKSHKIPNLDGIVKSGRKEWNEANLWSLSKFLFLLPTGFISIHMLPMWSLEPQIEAAELWIILPQNIQVEYRNKISESYALSSHQSKAFKNNVLLLLPWVLCVHCTGVWKAKCGYQCQGITLQDRWKRRFNGVCGYVIREL